jgi:hypothetical protein
LPWSLTVRCPLISAAPLQIKTMPTYRKQPSKLLRRLRGFNSRNAAVKFNRPLSSANNRRLALKILPVRSAWNLAHVSDRIEDGINGVEPPSPHVFLPNGPARSVLSFAPNGTVRWWPPVTFLQCEHWVIKTQTQKTQTSVHATSVR